MSQGNDPLPTLAKLIDRVSVEDYAIEDITLEMRFLEDLKFDSVKSIMLATLIESEFGLDLKQQMGDLMKVKSVGEACEFILRQKGIKAC